MLLLRARGSGGGGIEQIYAYAETFEAVRYRNTDIGNRSKRRTQTSPGLCKQFTYAYIYKHRNGGRKEAKGAGG